MVRIPSSFWSVDIPALLQQLGTTPDGLSTAEARARLETFGANRIAPPERTGDLRLLLSQFESPILLLLLSAAALSFFLRDPTDAAIILTIIGASGLLGFWQERGAAHAVERLLATVEVHATVLRDGRAVQLSTVDVVPGDVILVEAGSVIPADCRILESKDLSVDEAAFTGEPYPVAKAAATLPPETRLAERTNALFLGTHVVSGEAKAVVMRTGKRTEFGELSKRLRPRPAQTEFERGVRRFGYFLLRVTLLLVGSIFVINLVLARPLLESLLFSLALAVGLTPQLLPAIISVNLSHGARRMAARKVIVKRLASIENFGSMDVLCADKTGTLTEGVLVLKSAQDIAGGESERVLLHAYLNAHFQTGYVNPFDEAIRRHRAFDVSGYRKLDEIPYDFQRKRLSVLLAHEGENLIVTKGALHSVLAVCTEAELPDGRAATLEDVRGQVEDRYARLSAEGFRVLGVAIRRTDADRIEQSDEAGLTLIGLIVVFDPPRPDAADAVRELAALGVRTAMISGDNALVATYVGRQIGMTEPRVLTGADLEKLDDHAMAQRVTNVDIFAEIDPTQKERIILALRRAGCVVGYLGDGINDAPALRAADVGISVESAVDVAREAADLVLLEKDLGILVDGVCEGRRTFANTMKYVFMATSANFGNMFSMAGASLFLPFLPLLPKQILTANLLTDIPETAIAGDRVDPETIERPRRWDIHLIRKFMLAFGLLSSVFDYATFAVLLLVLQASEESFRTGWLIESVVSAALIVLVIRSRRQFFRTRPARGLLLATLGIVAATLALPYTPLAAPLELRPLPASFLLALGGILALYIAGAELTKRWFYGHAVRSRVEQGAAGHGGRPAR